MPVDDESPYRFGRGVPAEHRGIGAWPISKKDDHHDQHWADPVSALEPGEQYGLTAEERLFAKRETVTHYGSVRAAFDRLFRDEERLDGCSPTSRELREEARKAEEAGIVVKGVMARILTLADVNPDLTGNREIARRLNEKLETVEKARQRFRRTLTQRI